MTGRLYHPLRLTAAARPMVFGGHAIAQHLGRSGLPDWAIGETWEVSDVDGAVAVVTSGDHAGTSLRELVHDHPDELMGRGWRGERFPLLARFIDAAGTLPVHLHPDDAAAERLEGAERGRTEAWHVLRAGPGATVLCGTRAGVTATEFRRALEAQDFDAVLRRLPVSAGQTVYVPGGTPHSFGPDTLVYEISQTSDLQQHAMHWQPADGSPIDDERWQAALDALVDAWDPAARPAVRSGLDVVVDDGVDRRFLCAGPFFALERWTAGTAAPLRHAFDTAVVLSNVGPPVTVAAGGEPAPLGRGETLLLPAACGDLEVEGPADVLLGYLPDLDADVSAPLLAAGYAPALIAGLGDVPV
ncbi:class I mannose-6-phosphate isomerase [Modestobacter marinus]|uniref:class I mannose-6-phosphate isomerase n=1 Tax=Modestobacter marinus TaxID=477641 RepID=UPI001C9512FE|nr:class I mannose-6-phosphate isomerase [Modestobacter marinus]